MAVVAPNHQNNTSTFLSDHPRSHSAISMGIDGSQDPQDLIEEPFTALFCRALYDYDAQDPSALSFRRNDIIEVLSQEPSGWWDGLVGDERGWFPSNYVVLISEEEAELAFSGADPSNAEQQAPAHALATSTTQPAPTHQARDSVIDMSHAMMGGTQQENEDWLDGELSLSTARALHNAGSGSSWDNGASSSDFWMPSVAPNGQVCPYNELSSLLSKH
jgi:son of sevenless